jgi:hypothetical protein
MLKEINQRIKEGALQSANKFLERFLENEEMIVDHLGKFSGLQSEVYISNVEKELEQLKFASIFSDVISMYTVTPQNSTHHISILKDDGPYGYDRQLTIPASLTNEIKQTFQLLPGYSFHNSSDLKKTIKYCSSLLDSERAILRPTRTLLVDEPRINGQKRSAIYYAQGNTDTHHWILKDSFDKETLTIENYLRPIKVQQLMELTVPYFRDIKLDKLTKILDDEQDCVSPFRKELKNLIVQFDSLEGNIKELQQDVLRPQLDAINRRFNHLKNVHTISALGSVSMFSLSLIKVFIPDANISSLISSIISGASFSGIIASDIKFQTDKNALRENPYFLLWRLRKM